MSEVPLLMSEVPLLMSEVPLLMSEIPLLRSEVPLLMSDPGANFNSKSTLSIQNSRSFAFWNQRVSFSHRGGVVPNFHVLEIQ